MDLQARDAADSMGNEHTMRTHRVAHSCKHAIAHSIETSNLEEDSIGALTLLMTRTKLLMMKVLFRGQPLAMYAVKTIPVYKQEGSSH